MAFLELFRRGPVSATSGLQPIWQLGMRSALYVEIQLRAIYARIISEVLSRSHSIPEAFRPLLRDSMEGEGQRGLTEHIVRAMAGQTQLILKYEAGILYVPEYGERERIAADWKRGLKPPRTLMLSFQNYDKTTMLRQYLEHKYLLLCTQHKALNLSSALQIKVNELRSSVALSDADKAKDQARDIARALLDGSPALLDAKDVLELLVPDTGPLEAVAEDVRGEMSLILGLPIAWVSGKQKVGLGDSGDADARAIERGLEPYFWESVHPAFRLLFGVGLKFKSENHQTIDQALEALKTFELVGDSLVSRQNKRLLVSKLLDVEPDGTEVDEGVQTEPPVVDE